MNKHLATDMADANGQQRAIRPTAFFNIKKMVAEFCSAQCIMDNTGSLNILWIWLDLYFFCFIFIVMNLRILEQLKSKSQ